MDEAFGKEKGRIVRLDFGDGAPDATQRIYRWVETFTNWTAPVIEPLDDTEAEDERAAADAEAGRWPVG